MAAPFEVNVSGTDDETFTFSIPIENDDGSPFPFADYAHEYAVSRDGRRVLFMSEGDGVTIAAPLITFRAPTGRLAAGRYEHGYRLRSLATGDEIQIFDGTVTLTEGSF